MQGIAIELQHRPRKDPDPHIYISTPFQTQQVIPHASLECLFSEREPSTSHRDRQFWTGRGSGEQGRLVELVELVFLG
jgi:hypothetical protein